MSQPLKKAQFVALIILLLFIFAVSPTAIKIIMLSVSSLVLIIRLTMQLLHNINVEQSLSNQNNAFHQLHQTSGSKSSQVSPVQNWSMALISSLEWKNFEVLCQGYFIAIGYRAEVSREGADGGVDIFIYKDSYSATKAFGIVQCKAWNSYKVGVKPIRELYGVMAAEKAPLAIFMTSGSYTKEAETFAKGKHLKLLTGEAILALLEDLPEQKSQQLLTEVTKGDYLTPSCPSCGIKMVKRVSSKGKNVGNEFWGCSSYPRCRNTLKLKK